MHKTHGAMTVTINAAWPCPSGHLSGTTMTARVSLTATSLTVHHPVGVALTRCRKCRAVLTADPVLTVPTETQDRLAGWADRRGLPVAFDWAVSV